jgi:hypothetical protein
MTSLVQALPLGADAEVAARERRLAQRGWSPGKHGAP